MRLQIVLHIVMMVPGTPSTAGWDARAEQIAAAYWGQVPCGEVIVDYDALPNDWWADSPVGASITHSEPCEVTFDRYHGWTWPRYCTSMIHEYGHLLGNHHSEDPNSVMFPWPVIASQCAS